MIRIQVIPRSKGEPVLYCAVDLRHGSFQKFADRENITDAFNDADSL
jgi:hypothetical protein